MATKPQDEEFLSVCPLECGKVAKYKMRAMIGMETERCFVSAWAVGTSEVAATLCATYDGALIVSHDSHPYFESQWVLREFPEQAELIGIIEKRCKEQLALAKGLPRATS